VTFQSKIIIDTHTSFYNTSRCDYSPLTGIYPVFSNFVSYWFYIVCRFIATDGCEFIIQIGRRVLSSWFHMQHVIEFRSITMAIFRASAKRRNCAGGISILAEYRYLVIYRENKRILSARCRAASFLASGRNYARRRTNKERKILLFLEQCHRARSKRIAEEKTVAVHQAGLHIQIHYLRWLLQADKTANPVEVENICLNITIAQCTCRSQCECKTTCKSCVCLEYCLEYYGAFSYKFSICLRCSSKNCFRVLFLARCLNSILRLSVAWAILQLRNTEKKYFTLNTNIFLIYIYTNINFIYIYIYTHILYIFI